MWNYPAENPYIGLIIVGGIFGAIAVATLPCLAYIWICEKWTEYKTKRNAERDFGRAHPINVTTLAGNTYALQDWGRCKDLKEALHKLAPSEIGKPSTFELIGDLGPNNGGRVPSAGVVIDTRYSSDDRTRMMSGATEVNLHWRHTHVLCGTLLAALPEAKVFTRSFNTHAAAAAFLTERHQSVIALCERKSPKKTRKRFISWESRNITEQQLRDCMRCGKTVHVLRGEIAGRHQHGGAGPGYFFIYETFEVKGGGDFNFKFALICGDAAGVRHNVADFARDQPNQQVSGSGAIYKVADSAIRCTATYTQITQC